MFGSYINEKEIAFQLVDKFPSILMNINISMSFPVINKEQKVGIMKGTWPNINLRCRSLLDEQRKGPFLDKIINENKSIDL